ncbi:MAG TPA: hypothetical protein VGG48_14380 [Rhizomicrobium sp.]
MSSILTCGTSPNCESLEMAMGDSYDNKPVPNLRLADVLGILFLLVIGLMSAYLVVMFVYHLFTGRAPV